jgi:hypothetical protein
MDHPPLWLWKGTFHLIELNISLSIYLKVKSSSRKDRLLVKVSCELFVGKWEKVSVASGEKIGSSFMIDN